MHKSPFFLHFQFFDRTGSKERPSVSQSPTIVERLRSDLSEKFLRDYGSTVRDYR